LAQSPVILWFRNDLRLADNPALDAALASGGKILCVYIHDEKGEGLRPAGGASRWRLDLALRALSESLAHLGGDIFFLRGEAEELLPRLVEARGAQKIFWNRRYGGGEIALDARLKALLREQGREVSTFNGSLLAEPWEVATKTGGTFKVFTPFWRALRENLHLAAPLPAPGQIDFALWPEDGPPWVKLGDLSLAPQKPDWARDFPDPAAGEAGAQRRLERFLAENLDAYALQRDRIDRSATSGLSAHLHFGEMSPRQVFAEAAKKPGADKFLSELGWREFSTHLLFAHPNLAWRNFNPRFDAFPWRRDETALHAWQKGQTGYPLVDAGMRELWQTGVMHNRARMVCASFLTKHLLIDWRKGEAWFWDTLIDADAANNAASWQWVAGCGADAAPYFRIFNPVLQGEKFDPEGAYVRRYCPELSALPAKFIHRPWTAPPSVLTEADVRLGDSYPAPIVDHDFARRRALAAFSALSA
jgi:deoxyribodipyrimidine photo-lyase